MIDRRKQSRRVRLGALLGLVAGTAWVALEDRPDPAHADATRREAPTIIAAGAAHDAIVASTRVVASATAAPARDTRWAIPAGAIDPRRATLIDFGDGTPHLGQVLEDGTRVQLTLDPRVQAAAQTTLERYKVEWGAVVAIRPKTGEILAFAEHAEGRPDLSRLGLHAGAPAASVFKVITAAALIESGGLTPDSESCTHGGHHKLTLYNLTPNAKLDTKCETLAQALGSSNNVAFARWADSALEPLQLQAMANRFLFGKRVPFPWAVGISEARIPTASRLGLARAAAGFEGTTLSPLHAALVTATVANDGTMMAPFLVAKADRAGEVLFEAHPAELAKVLKPDTAKSLRTMLEATITYGTGRKFFERKGKPRLSVRAGGKSGSLSGQEEGLKRFYSWFVALAPIDDPEIAVAALVVNGEQWTIKGAVPAREVLAAYFADAPGAPGDDPRDADPLAEP